MVMDQENCAHRQTFRQGGDKGQEGVSDDGIHRVHSPVDGADRLADLCIELPAHAEGEDVRVGVFGYFSAGDLDIHICVCVCMSICVCVFALSLSLPIFTLRTLR